MTNEQAREVFNAAAATAKDADQLARIELAREYFTNAKFRKALEQHIWEMTNE
jgi:hypothetical protein